jgi:serine/threonine protein phosphatase 1
MDHWYRNGGKVTHFRLNFLSKALRRELLDYLKGLPLQIDLTVNGKAYCLVHGAPAHTWDGEPPYRNPVHYAVWKRLEAGDSFPDCPTLVFGHTPTQYFQEGSPMTVWYGQNLIGIDCGSGYPEHSSGRLACLRLDDGKEFYSEEG